MTTQFMQTLLDGVEEPLEVGVLHETQLSGEWLDDFNEEMQPLGIAPGYSKKDGSLVALAIADDTHCLIVRFYSSRRTGDGNGRGRGRGARGGQPQLSQPTPDFTGRKLLQDVILSRNGGMLLAFDAGPLAMSLYCLDGEALRITNAVDIQSAFSAVDRKPISSIKEAVGDTIRVFDSNVETAFRNPFYDENDPHCRTDLANRAWISQYLATLDNGESTFGKVKKIDTLKLPAPMLNILSKMTSDSLRLSNLKPSEKKHEFEMMMTNDGVGVRSGSFATRFRGNEEITMRVENSSGQSYRVHGQSGGVDGRQTNLTVPRPLDQTKTILSIKSIGRDDPTTAEARRAATVLSVLQGNIALLTNNAWIKNIWLPPSDGQALTWPTHANANNLKASTRVPAPELPSNEDLDRLNASQRSATEAMLHAGDERRIVLIQGPPGTGKTSVIAAYVKTALQQGQTGIWLVAKSNVAVINIALKLDAVGFSDWRLLASRDFSHEDWHGHLYSSIKKNFIRSDEFRTITKTRMMGCKVILCTLSMLSNKRIQTQFRSYVAINRIIVDEASQIEIGDYLPVLDQYGAALCKMCFIGDDKQLPPYGQEDLQDLQSVFEVTHLQQQSFFLNTQYRMPPQIGSFISQKVYDDQLKSNPHHPVPDTEVACYFVDVIGSREVLNNKTYSNPMEMQAVIQLATLFQERNKSYKIITPYDGQRELIEHTMKATEGLDWEEKVYNVDSFQGNEEDIIIISLRAMYIISSKAFLQNGAGKDCIVGELGEHVGELGWLDSKELESGDFLDSPRKREID
ncbi:AAA-12 domain-containing protein [Mycena chlorophos]|uniref:AAA-12 domain-containing protein n=1 Tax=Mycena chlorophos TaxID=658473 RepID=A0A8H6TDR1_MYCCL|nr:AAA-12 domain-containing protein [Mycena chlorophos]